MSVSNILSNLFRPRYGLEATMPNGDKFGVEEYLHHTGDHMAFRATEKPVPCYLTPVGAFLSMTLRSGEIYFMMTGNRENSKFKDYRLAVKKIDLA